MRAASLANQEGHFLAEHVVAPALDVPVAESPSVLSPDLSERKSEEPSSTSLSPPPVTSSTGISPFAMKASYPDGAPNPLFDLNAIWSAPQGDATEETYGADVAEHEDDMQVDTPEAMQAHSPVPTETTGELHDHDFDMFLDGGEEEHPPLEPQPSTPEAQLAAFESIPKVWNGKVRASFCAANVNDGADDNMQLSMPLDSTIPQEVSVTARQMGGRHLDGDSTCWQVLFPVDHLRIDGRVQVDKSALYLTQMRLNPSKELIAVAFSPDSDTSVIPFDTLAKHLISKGYVMRHNLSVATWR